MIEFEETKQSRKYAQLLEEQEERAIQSLAQSLGIGYVDLTMTPINTDALILIPEKVARAQSVAAFNKINKLISVAFHAPNNPEVQHIIDELTAHGYQVEPYTASLRSLQFAWERYNDVSATTGSTRGLLDVSGEEITTFLKDHHSIQDVQKYISEITTLKKAYRVSRIVEVMIASALSLTSSDIHIEPQETDVRIRMRLDGILTDIATFDHETYRLLLSRIKLLSGLKLNIASEAQDGRFSIKLEKAEVEIRTSILPGQYGESIVMRILNPDAISVAITELGIDPDLLEIIKTEMGKPSGMILTTGPTGSGKTTTLYAFLRHVHTPEVKILTIEDPVEYHLKGMVQTQVDPDKNYTFSSGLRAALRQDPDIIMVGEIRDSETAETALHAALTGHLVLSTLHTNSAAGAFTRLMDLGLNSATMGSAINIAIAQRLVRRLCEHCKQQVPLAGKDRDIIEGVLKTVYRQEKIATIQQDHVWQPVGCDQCANLGYKGRIGIHEAILVDDALEEIIRGNPSEHEIQRSAHSQGIFSLAQDSVVKILTGITSVAEVMRVVDLTDLPHFDNPTDSPQTVTPDPNTPETASGTESENGVF